MQKFTEFLKESPNRKIIAVYPGRFQLPHKGHKFVYEYLKKKFSDVYIATSNKTDAKSPFNFAERKELLEFLGIPANKIIQTRSPNNPKEITEGLSKDTVLVIAAGAKVQEEENRFPFTPKKDGTPGYFQPYDKNKNDLKGYRDHAYIIFVPTQSFKVMGETVKSASELRRRFASLSNSSEEKTFIEELYGKYSRNIALLLRRKID